MRNFYLILVLFTSFIPINVTAFPSDTSVSALNILNKWNDTMTQKGLVSHDMKFDKKFLEFKDTNKWFNIESKIDEKDSFYKFSTDSDGSNYYLWFYPELKGEPPVVSIDLSDDSADSVTENMTDFACSFILGKTLSGKDVYNRDSKNFHELEEFKAEMLKTLACKPKIKVFFGLTKHPKFDEWLDKLDIKYEN